MEEDLEYVVLPTGHYVVELHRGTDSGGGGVYRLFVIETTKTTDRVVLGDEYERSIELIFSGQSPVGRAVLYMKELTRDQQRKFTQEAHRLSSRLNSNKGTKSDMEESPKTRFTPLIHHTSDW